MTINELTEITTINSNTYIPVSNNGETVKYDISSLSTELEDVSDSIGDLAEFSTSKKYYPGQFVKYQNKVYKFTKVHSAGVWNINEVKETNIFQEFQGLDENVVITISSLDDLGGKTIAISVEGESNQRNLTTNSLGQAETSITKGLTYSVYPQVYGSYIVQNYLNIKAGLSERYINIPYQLGQAETCTLEVNIIASGVGGSINDFIGLDFTITNQSNQQISTATIDNNGKAIFSNVVKYTTYTINSTSIIPSSGSYRKPANSTILTNFNTSSTNIEYVNTRYGLFLVNGTTWEETELTTEFIDTLSSSMKDTFTLIHVCTEALANVGCDYYVRCRDLTSERLATESASKQWNTDRNVKLPHVSTNTTTEYNGKKQTYYMLYDSIILGGIQSPAAEFASNQNLNGMSGFIGTRAQMNIIYGDTTNRTAVRDVLTKLGYSNPNFSSVDTWSSTSGASYGGLAHYWMYSGNWANIGYNQTPSKFSHLIVPFFSK